MYNVRWQKHGFMYICKTSPKKGEQFHKCGQNQYESILENNNTLKPLPLPVALCKQIHKTNGKKCKVRIK